MDALLLSLKVIVFAVSVAGLENVISVRPSECEKNCFCCAKKSCSHNNICDDGCRTGYHGGKCINKCPDKCLSCSDHPDVGSNKSYLENKAYCQECTDGYFSTAAFFQCQNVCPDGCIACDADGKCTSCKDGFYTTELPGTCNKCSERCTTCVNEKQCKSCKDGYFMSPPSANTGVCLPCPIECDSCNSSVNCESCNIGFYGQTCTLTCSKGCKNKQCSKVNGSCECKVEFAGSKCDKCQVGKYGDDCNQNCSNTCNNNECSRYTGACISCKDSFTGQFCENCVNGKFGLYCNNNCSELCINSICNRSNGHCLDCPELHEGPICENCSAGRYGVNCYLKCPRNCLNGYCDRDSGDCFNCSENTFGLKCNNCVDTFYGSDCLQQCSSSCRNLTCDQGTGVCNNGCKEGYSGDKCCLNNMYCQQCSSNEICIHCISGKFGEKCEETCTDICVDRTCDKERGICSSSIVNVTSIVISVVVTVVVIIAIAVLFLLRKRLTFPFFEKNTKKTTNNSIMFSQLIGDNRNGEQKQGEENRKSRPISFVGNEVKHRVKINQLATYVSLKTKESYTKEFKDLPDGLIKPCTDARKPENIAKNRYQSIYPYDEHRVKLTGPGSDFINACYIDGFNRRKEYIASLGPIMKATENFILFWRMLWQEKVEKIVMVTNLIENGTMKCEQYWPTTGNTDCYGDVSVTCHSEDVYSDYTRRTFTVAKGKMQRSLTHLHFTAWPDKGVPDDVTSLIEFRQKVIATKVTLGGPMIVHCSAGVGRTGTFIALDRLTKEGEKERAVDVFQCVYNMRQQRTKMVQTEDQYEYLHHAIVHSLTFGSDAIPAEKFKQYVRACKDKVMQSKFEQLNNNTEKLSEKETNAVINNKKREELNRSGADVPGNCHRIWLYEGRTSEEIDYINAVYINGYKQKNRYIVAQTPLPRTVADFITMVIQERISCILSMDVDNSMDKNVGRYIPNDNQTMKIGQFEISSAKVASNKCYTLKKMTVCWKAKAIVRTVSHYQCTHWSDNMKVPAEISLFLQLIRDVEKKADKDPNKGPILVHCLNGAEKSGLFCAVSIMLQKMEIEHEVSVVNTLRQLKVRRALAIPNKEQYVFCHACVSSYLDTFEDNVYSNFALQRK